MSWNMILNWVSLRHVSVWNFAASFFLHFSRLISCIHVIIDIAVKNLISFPWKLLLCHKILRIRMAPATFYNDQNRSKARWTSFDYKKYAFTFTDCDKFTAHMKTIEAIREIIKWLILLFCKLRIEYEPSLRRENSRILYLAKAIKVISIFIKLSAKLKASAKNKLSVSSHLHFRNMFRIFHAFVISFLLMKVIC